MPTTHRIDPGHDAPSLERAFHAARLHAAGRLKRPLRNLVEPDDIAGEAAVILGRRLPREIDSPEALGTYAAGCVLTDVARGALAAKRDARRTLTGWTDSAFPEPAIAGSGSPLDELIATETREQLLRGLTPNERRIIAMREQGHSTPECARSVGWDQRRAQRFLATLRARLVK